MTPEKAVRLNLSRVVLEQARTRTRLEALGPDGQAPPETAGWPHLSFDTLYVPTQLVILFRTGCVGGDSGSGVGLRGRGTTAE